MPAALDRLIRRLDPDPTPIAEAEPPQHDPFTSIEPDEPACTCKAFDGWGQNPECPEHPWWSHDTDVLHLADLTRELGSALAPARAKFGGGS